MKIKNWTRFQHYKHRNPPWIRLYRDLLNDRQWMALSGDASKLLACCWLIASERDGNLPSVADLAWRLRMDEKTCARLIRELDHWIIADASTALAPRKQVATTETETETETEKIRDASHPLSPNGDNDLGKAFDAYNETAKALGLPIARTLDSGRRQKLSARLKTYGLAGWMQALANLADLPFCLGSNDRGWKASFDFLIQAKSFPKVLEMQYGGEAKSRTQQAFDTLDEVLKHGTGEFGICEERGTAALLKFPKPSARSLSVRGTIDESFGGTAENRVAVFGGSTDGLPCDCEPSDHS